ncbi:MAG: MBL fold metallo-hydrolase [Blastocatellia bacterium]|nr:MBL fold metallo-hydrolase [Blastocatellia bacterium]
MKKRSRFPILILLLIAIAVGYYIYQQQRKPEPVPGPVAGKLTVHFLDIGQGDSQLIRLPGGETILIDSGDRGAPTVDLLKKYGVTEIDLIIASHPHADHIGEMRDIMRAFKVKEVWDSGFNNNTKTQRDMLEEIRSRGIKLSLPKQGETRAIGQALLEVLNPPARLPDEANNASLVVRLTFGKKRFLFTGDAEEESWERMIATVKDKLRADLLKAAHHGSSNGTMREVLEAVRPDIVTISCAAENSYHHPHPRVVNMLEDREGDVKLFRTDLQGAITATSDGDTIEMTAEKQVARNRLYLTGDEVAGKVAGDGRGKSSGGRSMSKGK